MKLVWHIVAKDLRRMWLPLLLWSVVLIAKNEIGVNLWLGDASDLAHFDLMKVIATVLAGLDAFVNMVLVALLVHEDAVVGTRQFWMTRPVSSGRLLAAKLVGAAVMFGVLPVALSLRWWWASDYDAGEMVRAALLVWDGQAMICGFALVVAALTENMNRFLLGMFGGLILLYAWLGATMQFVGFRPDAGGVGQTRFALVGGLLVIAAAMVVVRQFRRQMTGSLVVLGVALLLATLVAGWWPWNWISEPREAKITGAEKIQATVTQADTERTLGVRLSFRFADLPKEFGLRGRTLNTWELPGESLSVKAKLEPLWPTWAEWQALSLPADQFRGPAHRSAKIIARSERFSRQGQRPPRGSDAEDEAQAVGFLDTHTLERMAGVPAPFRSELTLELFHPVASFEVVPRTGERDGRDGWHARLAQAEFRDGLLFVRLVESRSLWDADGRWDSRAGLSVFLRGFAQKSEERAYYQVNRAKGTAHSLGRRGGGFEAAVSGQIIRWQTLTLGSPEQMKGATLAGIRYESDGVLHREVKLDHLAVTAIEP